MQTTNTTKSVVAFFLMLIMLVSSFLPYVPTKTALAGGVTMGSAGSVSAVGAQKGLAGGITYVDDMIFRVGLNRSELYYHNGSTAEKAKVYEQTKHMIPNVINALYFVPSGKATPNYQIGVYNGSSRTLDAISSADSKNVVFNLHGQGSQPANTVKDVLKKYYNRDGSGGKKAYKDLLGYKWKASLLANITKEDAIKIWSYILAPTSSSSSGSTYAIEKRINAMVSPYAEQLGVKELTPEQQEDIYIGYLGLLVATYKLVPEKMMGLETNGARTPYGEYWARGPEAYLKITELNLARQPITLAIDTAMEIKWNGSSTRMYISAFDYLYYYTAVSNANLPRGNNKDIYVTQGNGDYYKLFTAVVKKDVAGAKIKRISDAYNPSNVFSFAASTIDYPGYQFFTTGGNARYLRGGGQTAFIDTLVFYRAQSSVARGYIMSTFMVKLGATDTEANGDLKPYLVVNPKEKLVKSGQKVIGESNILDIKHKPNSDLLLQWEELFQWSDKQPTKPNQKIKVKVQIDGRAVTPSASGQPIYTSPSGGITTSYVDFTRDELKDFIKGKKVITVYDNVAAEPIEAGTTKKFTYSVKLSYQYTNSKGQQTKFSEQMTDWASYIRPKDPPKYMGFTSDYETYGEIKHDRPNNEKWEAMAGVPSNKSLYFSVGGSEFVADVELEYIEDETSVWRTYRSYFSGTPSEYKDGDNAGTGSIGGHSVDLHNGGTYTKTWSGSIPNKGESKTVDGSGDVSATAVAVPDRTEYNNAMKEAQAYIKEVNNTVITHTAASDKITRSHKNWGAHVSTDAPNDPKTITETNSCWHTETVGSGEDQTTIEVPDPCSVTATKDADGTFTIVVSFTVPPHIVDGPECTYDLPLVEDNWRQKISYDYVKIIRAEVYQLVEGKLKKVDHVLDSEEDITATIQSGKTSMWHNIAQQNSGGDDKAAQSSKHGRIRYTLEELQHDTVVWNEGTRTNKSAGMGANGASTAPDTAGKLAVQGGGHNNAWSKQGILYNRPASQISDTVDAHKNIVGQKTSISTSVDSLDMATPEWKKFDERRHLKNIATIVSDFIILQTSSGDMSVMYFQKDSKEITAQEQFPDVEATREEMWENNPLSSANWDVKEIPMGSYNGWFKEVGTSASNNKKFWGYDRFRKTFINNISGGSTANYRHKEIKTRLDKTGGGVFGANKRTTRPSAQLQIYINKNIIPTTPNDDYEFGESHSFFERLVTYKSANPYKDYPGVELRKNQYTPKNEPDFGNKMGLKEEVGYSRNHELINKIVIHTPVSVQDATIIGLPSYLDQRTATPAGGAAELIDRDNANRVAYENSLGTPNIFTDAIKQWTNTKTTIGVSTTTEITHLEGGGKDTKKFAYTGGVQTFVAPANGAYTLEVWGAEGGTSGFGGKGGYSKGTINLTKGQTLYIYVGGQTGFNGGGSGHGRATDSGGGGTDIRVNGSALGNRVIVAGGGGGWGSRDLIYGGAGGGITGGKGLDGAINRQGGYGGTQSSGGTGGNGVTYGIQGSLGQGGSQLAGSSSGGGGGGGGYYGGGSGGSDYPNYNDYDDGGGGGGSGYIGGVTSGTMISGDTSQPSPSGSTQVGQSGNGYAKISYDLPPTTGSGGSTTTVKDKPVLTDVDSYYESGNPLGYKGYTWADLFGPNWTKYVKVTTTTNVDTSNSSSSVKDDKGVQGLAKGWTFDSSTEGFTNGTAIVSYVGGGYLRATSSTTDGYFYSPSGLGIKNLSSSKDFIEIRLKNNGSGKIGEIFFTTNSQGSFVETHKLQFSMTANDANYVTYRIPTSQSLNWTGTLTRLRFDLANGRDTSDVLVDYIKVYTADAAVNGGSSGGSTPTGTVYNYGYTGGLQTFTAPSAGSYQLEVWGAQGGNDTWAQANVPHGGKGGYSKGTVNLNAGETIYIGVGGKGADTMSTGGSFNGGGQAGGHGSGGGGATHMAKANGLLPTLGSSVSSILLIAGGGGGLDYGGKKDADGGYGGGLTAGTPYGISSMATQYSGYAFGQGQPIDGATQSGGGGGGYYGGFIGVSVDQTSYGSGGSGYIGGVTGGQSIAGNLSQPAPLGGTQVGQTGNGFAKITVLDTSSSSSESIGQIITTTTDLTVVQTITTEITTVDTEAVKRDLDSFPEYMPDGTPNPVRLGFGKPSQPSSIVNTPIETSTGGQINVGTFILLDREFQVYYPNRGDFAQQPTLHGIPEITTTRGLSYVNGMDVTEWTESKYISFEFAVIYEGVLYPKGSWIELPVPQEYFDFYAVLGNNEYVAADVKYQSYAINYIGDEPDDVTNKRRYDDYTARSTAYKLMYTDVVGRIGNFQVTDTEDFRFSNLFKQPKPDGKWIVEGIVKEVDPAKQNKFYADLVDIRNVNIADTGVGLDTYGTQSWIRGNANRLNLPVNPNDNVHSALKEEYLKTGYDLFSSIQTIGDYGRGAVRVLPYYYKLDLKTGEMIPIDAYQKVEDRYEPVNKFGAADGGFVPSEIYPYQLVINWIEEASRFNYTLDEAEVTALASQTKGDYRYGEVVDIDGEIVQGIQSIDPLMTPSGSFINIGNAQRIVLDSTARTFIGNTETYGNDKNPGDVLDDADYHFHGQKWYMKIGLPASTAFVEKGKEPTKENIEALQEGAGVVLMAADIISIGDVYTLRYNQYTDRFTAFKDGVGGTFNVTDLINSARQKGVNLPPIIALYDLETTATIDVDLQGSH